MKSKANNFASVHKNSIFQRPEIRYLGSSGDTTFKCSIILVALTLSGLGINIFFTVNYLNRRHPIKVRNTNT